LLNDKYYGSSKYVIYLLITTYNCGTDVLDWFAHYYYCKFDLHAICSCSLVLVNFSKWLFHRKKL